ncbi:MAG: Helix-turn-helix domain [Chthoniobacteraceae bacterium]|nr:Helix-turn-helix domain [Chthoniobacteraceae bacterium]
MPRPSLSNHPLAKIRELLGLSQAQLAASIGVSQSAINAIESGSRELSKSIRIALLATYGLCPWHLDPNKPPSFGPQGLTAERLKNNQGYAKYLNGNATKDSEHLIKKFRALVEAAQSEQKAVALLASFDDWMNEMTQHMNLERSFHRAAMKRLGTADAIEHDNYIAINQAYEGETPIVSMGISGDIMGQAPKKPRQPSASRAPGKRKKAD